MEPQLNKTEVWIAEHSIRIFLVIAALIVIGGVFVVKTLVETGNTATKVKTIEPQVTNINRAICDRRSLSTDRRADRCAERIRVGLINCRQSPRCRAVLLATIAQPTPSQPSRSPAEMSPVDDTGGGGDAQNPSGAGQQPGPGKGPQGDNGSGQAGNQGQGQGGPPTGSPGVSGPPAAPPSETPGNGPPAAPGGGSSSGAGVEVCVPGVTCVEAEIGLPDLKPKGRLP